MARILTATYTFRFRIENEREIFCHKIAKAMKDAAALIYGGPLSNDPTGSMTVDGVTINYHTTIEKEEL